MIKMRYIITEDQNERLKRIIFQTLDSYLTPYNGWDPVDYKKTLKNPKFDREVFIDLIDMGEDYDLDETNHIFYSSCENPNYTYTRKNQCPEVVIPNGKFEILDDSFGKKVWHPYFLEWFTDRTKLPVNRVRKFNFGP